MKLYYSPGACSLSPHIVARELGIELTLEKVDLASKKTASGQDYLAINPKGYVPALEIAGGGVLTEGPAIVQYLADRKPEAGLAPAAGTLERARLQEWLGYINSEIHKNFSPLFNPKLSAERRQEAVDTLTKRIGYVAQTLQTQPYLLGERFSVADAYLFVVLGWAGYVKMDLGAWPVLQDFIGRVAGRPAVQAALKAEGLAK